MKKKLQAGPLEALWSGDPLAIQKLLHSKVNLNQVDAHGRTLLIEAVLEKRTDLVKLLLEHGGDPAVADHDGSTALHFAAQAQLPEIVQLLIDKGAPINAQDHLGNTPLFKALSTFRGEADGDAIWALLLAGADLKIKNTHAVSPEDLARGVSNYDLGRFLR